VTSNDSVWVVLDVDHHFDPTHQKGTLEALQIAQENGYSVVFSNPCFEVWLLMHTNHVLASVPLPSCEAIEAHLRKKWGFFQKTNFDVERLRPCVRSAIAQSRANLNATQTPPINPGTQVHLLLEALDSACGETKLF